MPARDNPDLDPALADAVRRAYVRPVDGDTASRHVSAIVAAAGDASTQPLSRPQRRRRPSWPPVAAAAAAITFLLPVGLAAAGVSLPSVVEDPYRAVGIRLPNQAKHAPQQSAPAPWPVTAGVPARTATTSAPQAATTAAPPRAGEPGARRERAPGSQGRSKTPATTSGQGASRRPATGSSGTGVSKKPITPSAASSRKPAAPKSSRKPAKPAKPVTPQSTRRNPGNRPGVATTPSAASQNGNGRGNARPKAGAP
jgi:hypothetical protein